MIVECTYGPVSTEVMGTVYTFAPDEYGRNVCEVWNPKHLEALTAVVHYQIVKREPDPLVLTEIGPATAQIGGADVVLSCIGTGFTKRSQIVFNGGEEPTTYVSGETLTTIVRPSTATTAGSYPVLVRDGEDESGSQDFTFTEPDVAEVEESEVGALTVEEESVGEEVVVEEEAVEVEPGSFPVAVTEITGIGATTAAKLAEIGVTDAAQIAAWTQEEADAIDAQLGLGGKIAREDWIGQAKALVA